MRVLFVIVFALVTASVASQAQDAVQYSENGFYVQTSGGQPAACGFEFKMVYTDRTYLGGRIAGVVGSLTWSEANGNVGLMLKITGNDMPDVAKRETAAKPFSVFQGFVAIDGKARAPNRAFPCQNPTDFCGVYWLPASADIFGALSSAKLSIGFARQAKGLDIMLPLDVRGGVNASSSDFRAFNECMVALIDRGERALKK